MRATGPKARDESSMVPRTENKRKLSSDCPKIKQKNFNKMKYSGGWLSLPAITHISDIEWLIIAAEYDSSYHKVSCEIPITEFIKIADKAIEYSMKFLDKKFIIATNPIIII
jgi:hypothetical protein